MHIELTSKKPTENNIIFNINFKETNKIQHVILPYSELALMNKDCLNNVLYMINNMF